MTTKLLTSYRLPRRVAGEVVWTDEQARTLEANASVSEDLRTFSVDGTTYSVESVTISEDGKTLLQNANLILVVDKSSTVLDLFGQPRAGRARAERILLAIARQLLPSSERDRYLEEFRAELLDVPDDTRLPHALSLLRGVFVVRLRRGFKKEATDAAARRGQGIALDETI
jgi:hypothetical protein